MHRCNLLKKGSQCRGNIIECIFSSQKIIGVDELFIFLFLSSYAKTAFVLKEGFISQINWLDKVSFILLIAAEKGGTNVFVSPTVP